jgi:DNA-binding CsgD family transcriptional regulator
MPLLTDREREILKLAAENLSDYKIARKLNCDPPSITRSRQNALRKLRDAGKALTWAKQRGYMKQAETDGNFVNCPNCGTVLYGREAVEEGR